LRQAVESFWHMSERDAAHYKDAVKITGTEEIRTPTGSTGDFFKSLPKCLHDRAKGTALALATFRGNVDPRVHFRVLVAAVLLASFSVPSSS